MRTKSNNLARRSPVERAAILAQLDKHLANPKAHPICNDAGDGMITSIEQLSPELIPALKKRAESLGTDVETVIIEILKRGVETPDLNQKERSRPQSEESQSPRETGAAAKLKAQTAGQRMDVDGKIQGLVNQGRFSEAKDLQKISNLYDKQSARADAQSEDARRSALVDAIIRQGQNLLR